MGRGGARRGRRPSCLLVLVLCACTAPKPEVLPTAAAMPVPALSPRPTISPSPAQTATGVDWATFGFDLARTGFNPSESTLSSANVPGLHLAWSANLEGPITAPPVEASGGSVEGLRRDLLFVGTSHGDFVAVDTASGALLWQHKVGAIETDCPELPGGTHGVTASAVLDRSRSLVYVVGGTGKVFALDLATGEVASGWPVTFTSDPERDHVYSALTLARGRLFVGMAGPCEPVPFHSRLVAIDVRTARVVATFYPTGEDGPSGGGIWGVGGVSVDARTGDMFVATGNARIHPEDYAMAEAVVRTTLGLKVRDWDSPGLAGVDSDFGATPLLFQRPGCPPQLAAENKDGELFIYRRSDLAGGPVQRIQVADATVEQFQGVPAFLPSENLLFVSDPSDSSAGRYRAGLLAFEVRKDCRIKLRWQQPAWSNQTIASAPVVAGGVVYVATGGDRSVVAIDASTGQLLWDSGQAIQGKAFAPPVPVNGKVYEPSWDGHLYAFEP